MRTALLPGVECRLPDGVVAAPATLTRLVVVRIHAGRPTFATGVAEAAKVAPPKNPLRPTALTYRDAFNPTALRQQR